MSNGANSDSFAVCAMCGTDLLACETIWAAAGALYCSRACGIAAYSVAYMFDNEAEEINPRDIYM